MKLKMNLILIVTLLLIMLSVVPSFLTTASAQNLKPLVTAHEIDALAERRG